MQASADEVRQAIIDNAKLDEVQVEELDKAIEGLNRQMLEVSTKWAEHIRESGTLGMDARRRMQHEMDGVIVSLSDRMDVEFPGWRGAEFPSGGGVSEGRGGLDLSRLIRITSAFEPLRKMRSEILRGEMGGGRARRSLTTEDAEDTEK